MAGFFESFGIADLALGKPGIQGLPLSSTVGDALLMLKDLNLSEVSVWECLSESAGLVRGGGGGGGGGGNWKCRECQCVGKVTFVDIICYYAREDKVHNIEAAAKDPVLVLLNPASKPQFRHLSFSSRLTEAFNLVLDGTSSFMVPLDTRRSKYVKSSARKTSDKYRRMDNCWVTHEDILRFLLGCIGVFSPMPMLSIKDLGIINEDVMLVDLNSKAKDALSLLLRASENMTAVAVVEQGLKIVGDISPAALRTCDEKVAALALNKLSVGDFWTYTQGDAQPLKEILTKSSSLDVEHVNSVAFDAALMDASDSSESEMWDSSSEESLNSVCWSRSSSSLLTCRPWSSLIAVMAQALAHRTSYVWVTDNENVLIGMVTYVDMISVLLNHLLAA